MEFILDGYCGLYCGACPDLLDTKDGKAKNPCCGCKSAVNNREWCAICNLKACAKEKHLDHCRQCDEYPCDDLQTFFYDPKYPYHKEAVDYLSTIEKEGKDVWLEKMKERWSCRKCGQAATWWKQSCTVCGETLNGYQKP